jgi:hypothetical protein
MVTTSSEDMKVKVLAGKPLNWGWEVCFSRDVSDFLLLVA